MSQRDENELDNHVDLGEGPTSFSDQKLMQRGLSTSARKINKDMEKTIDSEDEDGIVQHRERSRAAHNRREPSEVKDQIKLLNVNIPTNLDNKHPLNLTKLPIHDLQ